MYPAIDSIIFSQSKEHIVISADHLFYVHSSVATIRNILLSILCIFRKIVFIHIYGISNTGIEIQGRYLYVR